MKETKWLVLSREMNKLERRMAGFGGEMKGKKWLVLLQKCIS